MNIDHFRVFQMVANKKSFSEAAKLLHMSQPSITRLIQSLEEHYHVKLFERTTKNVELTEVGKILLRNSEQLLHLYENIEHEIRSLSDTIYGEVNIGAGFTVVEYVLPKMLGPFCQRFPFVYLCTQILRANEIVTNVLDEVIHVGLIEAPIFHTDLKTIPFMKDEIVLVASTQKHADIGEIIRLEELLDLPIIIRGSGTKTVINEELIKHGLSTSDMKIKMELGSTEAIKTIVEDGIGLSLLSKSAVEKEVKTGILKEIPIEGISFHRHFYIVLRKNQVIKPPVEVFVGALKDYGQDK